MATAATNLNTARTGVAAARPAFLQFAYLQGLDILTTLAFLLAGVQEGNPFVRAAIGLFGNPLLGLLAIKGCALLLGLYCWLGGRVRLLQRANLFFAGLVAWNLFCLLLGLGSRF